MTIGQPPARPLGVTILAVISAVGGVLGVVASVALLTGVLNFSDIAAWSGYSGSAISSTAGGLLTAAYTVLVLIFAYGAWTLKPWGWLLGLVIFGIGGLSDLLAGVVGVMAIPNVVIDVVIAALVIYYWFRPNVRAAFGRS
jgi:hypothetical protein